MIGDRLWVIGTSLSSRNALCSIPCSGLLTRMKCDDGMAPSMDTVEECADVPAMPIVPDSIGNRSPSLITPCRVPSSPRTLAPQKLFRLHDFVSIKITKNHFSVRQYQKLPYGEILRLKSYDFFSWYQSNDV